MAKIKISNIRCSKISRKTFSSTYHILRDKESIIKLPYQPDHTGIRLQHLPHIEGQGKHHQAPLSAWSHRYQTPTLTTYWGTRKASSSSLISLITPVSDSNTYHILRDKESIIKLPYQPDHTGIRLQHLPHIEGQGKHHQAPLSAWSHRYQTPTLTTYWGTRKASSSSLISLITPVSDSNKNVLRSSASQDSGLYLSGESWTLKTKYAKNDYVDMKSLM